eukprot:4686202-Ditylum_brightwellii.AAC.1
MGPTSAPKQQQQPDGTFAHLRRIFRSEGVSGLYAGLRPTLVMSVPNTVLYFTAYDEISCRLRRTSCELYDSQSGGISKETNDVVSNMVVPLVSGSTARLIASFITSPLELLRTRQASLVGSGLLAEGTSPPGMLQELRTLIRTEPN